MALHLDDNRPRQNASPGVESWFFRANHPTLARAVWIKATTLIGDDGSRVAEAWCSIFDEDDTAGAKSTAPLEACSFGGTPLQIEIEECSFVLDPDSGRLRGALDGDIRLKWDLEFRAQGGHAAPLCMLPTRRLVDARLPKNKLLTPMPVLRYDGTLQMGETEFKVDGWWGSQGHNWGAAHAVEYAWAQCVFLDPNNEPFCFMEGATGRIEIAGKALPRVSLLTIRRHDREYRFDRIVDLWNQEADIEFPKWTLRMKGPDGEALVHVEAQPERMVCLGYYNPDGELSYCLNSKTSSALLRVNPNRGDGFECYSPNGAALEFLSPDPDSRVSPVI